MSVEPRLSVLLSLLLVVGATASCNSDGKTTDADESALTDPVGTTLAETPCDPIAGRLECDSADFSKQTLDGLILAGGSFRGADFSYASLTGANFDGADLRSAIFDKADLTGANLSRTILEGSSFEYAILVGAKVQDTCLKDLNFDFSDLTLTDFSRSKGGIYMRAKSSNIDLAKNLDILNSENCS
jgi:uncharacterized protein YjbI with pentapeptide repeats